MPPGEDKESPAKIYGDIWRRNRRAEIKAVLCAAEEIRTPEHREFVKRFIVKEFSTWIDKPKCDKCKINLELVKADEPWSPVHYQCPKCDRTYNL